MRFAGKDLARGSYFVPWGGFTDATTSVVKVSAMSVSPCDTDRGQAGAGAANTGVGRPLLKGGVAHATVQPLVNLAWSEAFGKRRFGEISGQTCRSLWSVNGSLAAPEFRSSLYVRAHAASYSIGRTAGRIDHRSVPAVRALRGAASGRKTTRVDG